MISNLLRLLATGSLLVPLAGHGAPLELFFSEYVEGSSNNKALEIFNGTGSAVDLSGYSVHMHFNGNANATLIINLAGTVADGDVFVLAQASASPTILAEADQTNGAAWYNGDDAIVLRKDGAPIDVIGQVGFDPGTEWGGGLLSTADNTLRRMSTMLGGDADALDAFQPSFQWEGFANDTFGGLGSHALDPSGVPEPGTLALLAFALAGMALAYPSSTSRRGASSAMAISFSMSVPHEGQQNCRNCGVGSMKRRGSPTMGLDAWMGRSLRAQRAL